MKSLVFVAAFSALVTGQLTLDAFNSILGEAAEEAGIPQCGVSCLNDAFSFSKTSRACFVNSGSLECLCDNDYIGGSLMLCGDHFCGATESATFQYSVQRLCENRRVISSTSSSTSISSSTSTESSTIPPRSISTTTSSSESPSSPTISFDPNIQPAEPFSAQSFSAGTKAGIGAAVGALSIGAILLAFYLIRRRQKRKQNSRPLDILPVEPPSFHEDQKAELMGSPATPYLTPALTPMTDGCRFTVTPRLDMGLAEFGNPYKQYGTGVEQLAPYQHQQHGEVAELGTYEPVELAGGDEYRPSVHTVVADTELTSHTEIDQQREHKGKGEHERQGSRPLPAASELYPSPRI